jgi:hypothetical protein
MRKCILFIYLLITFNISAQDAFEFKPHTVFILSVESHQLDLIFLLGNVKNGDEIAVTIGRKGFKSNNSVELEMSFLLDGKKLNTVDEILELCRSSWYRVMPFLDDYRATTDGIFDVLCINYGIEKYTSATEMETILPVSEDILVFEEGIPFDEK